MLLTVWLLSNPSAQQVSQRDAPPVGGFEVLVFIKVRWLHFTFVSGAPLTVTLGVRGEETVSPAYGKLRGDDESTDSGLLSVRRRPMFLGKRCGVVCQKQCVGV